MISKYPGSCLCGEVKFEIIGDFESFYLCHCDRCRKDTGSAHAANLFSRTAKMVWISGKNGVRTFTLPSTRHIKSFCATCGSALPSTQMKGDLLVVPAGSLNCELPIRPNAHIFLSDKATWDEKLDELQGFEELPV
ncbi:GFA family protein [Cerasicoccus fimbriatus]|uniref:GFA family protein n=1 Tax=Cerasicoccus fimbriatus TaxID=3014554 RepID=UPI0031B88063